MRRLHTNAQLRIIEIDTVQFQKADQHVTEIGVFDCTIRTTGCATATITTVTTAQTIVEVIIVDIAVVVPTAIVIV